MATKKSTSTSTFTYGASNPKGAPTVAKPSAPVTRPSGALPKGGGQAASGTKLVPSTPSGKSSSKSSNQAAIDKLFKDINKNFEKLKGLGKTLTGGDIIDEDTAEDKTGGEDPSLAYSKMQDEKARQDAFALLRDVFNSYGLSELATEIEGYMRQGLGTAEATLKLKQSKSYTDRFYGNELRRSAGLNVISEAEYLDLENSYSETLKAYGLQDYFGVGATPNERKNRQKAIAEVIGKDISAVEFKDRVSTAIDRVKMADPATKSAFQQFYGIGEADLARYFLDPGKTLVTLKEKATAAEIGGAAIGQGLPATTTSAEDLARFGISREQAQVGYATIAEELPTATKLGQIYSQEGITYGQTEAEQATFKGLASAKRKKEQLKALEEAAFQGSSGVAPAGLKTTYLRQSSSAGYF